MTNKVYSPELIEKFVDEWRDAEFGPESFKAHCAKYPEEFKTVWLSINYINGGTWEYAKQQMLHKLYFSRTKLGRVLE